MISNCYRMETLMGVVIAALIIGFFSTTAFAARNLDDQIAQAQRDFVSGQISEIEAVVRYLKSLVELYRLDGSLLTRRGIAAPGE